MQIFNNNALNIFLIKGLDEKKSKGNAIETLRFSILKTSDFPLCIRIYGSML